MSINRGVDKENAPHIYNAAIKGMNLGNLFRLEWPSYVFNTNKHIVQSSSMFDFFSHNLYHYSDKAMAPHSSTLAWKIPWMEEPGGLQSMGSLSPTWLSNFTFTFHFHALEKAMAPHSSVLAWRIPWAEEPGRLPSMGSLGVGHHWATSLSLFTFMHWRRKWQPTPVFLPGESQGGGSLVGCHGVAQTRTRLKWLSSSSSSISLFALCT